MILRIVQSYRVIFRHGQRIWSRAATTTSTLGYLVSGQSAPKNVTEAPQALSPHSESQLIHTFNSLKTEFAVHMSASAIHLSFGLQMTWITVITGGDVVKLTKQVVIATQQLSLFLPLLIIIGCADLTVAPISSSFPPRAEWRVELHQKDRQTVVNLLRTGQFREMDKWYESLQQRYEKGKTNDQELVLQYQAFYDTSPENETYLNQWVTKNPKSYPARLARGIYNTNVGSNKRGGAWARDTPRENMVALSKYLDLANADLVDSLSLTGKPIVSLVTLVKSSMHRDGSQTNRMWLDYANRIDPKNYSVRRRYMKTLTPRWGGSYEEMWQFLKECQDQNLPAEYVRVFESQIYLDQANMFEHGEQKDKALPRIEKR